MFARSVARLPATAARRGFHTTPRQMGSPYHYPEGPRSNIPFNPLTKWFALRYWSFMGTCARKKEYCGLGHKRLTIDTAVGFGAPFGIAGKFLELWRN